MTNRLRATVKDLLRISFEPMVSVGCPEVKHELLLALAERPTFDEHVHCPRVEV